MRVLFFTLLMASCTNSERCGLLSDISKVDHEWHGVNDTVIFEDFAGRSRRGTFNGTPFGCISTYSDSLFIYESTCWEKEEPTLIGTDLEYDCYSVKFKRDTGIVCLNVIR